MVPAKSFFAQTEVEPAFLAAAHKLGRPVTVQTAKALPPSDPVAAVTSLPLLPLLIGGYLAAVLVFKAAGGTAAAPWRTAILTGYALVGALLTDLIAGPGIGAYSSSHFWPLLPCFWLITSAVVLAAAAIQGLAGKAGTLLTVIVMILLGNPSSGGTTGVPYLPTFWRDLGPYLPPRNAYILLHHTIYFNGHGTTEALTVLLVYLVVGAVILGVLDWFRSEPPVPADVTEAAAMAVPIGATP